MEKIKREQGNTLITLVIAGIIVLILAGVGMSSIINKEGIMKQAEDVAEMNNIMQEKEVLQLAVMAAQIAAGGYIDLNKENLQKEVNNEFGKEKATVQDNEDGSFTVSFVENSRNYNISEAGIEYVNN